MYAMQMKKNQSVQGWFVPSSVGCGAVTVVVMGAMMPGGQVVHTGSGVVVVLVVVGGTPVGGAAIGQSVTKLQSTEIKPVVEAKNVTTLVVGQVNPKTHEVGAGQSVTMVTDGVANTISPSKSTSQLLGPSRCCNRNLMRCLRSRIILTIWRTDYRRR